MVAGLLQELTVPNVSAEVFRPRAASFAEPEPELFEPESVLDPESKRPTPWTDEFRAAIAPYRADLDGDT